MPGPALRVTVAFNNNPLDTNPTFADISDKVLEAQINIGRHRELDMVEPGTARILLNNARGEFDPTNTASPYYPNILPMRRIKVSIVLNSITYDVFDGFIERWEIRYGVGENVVAVHCVDALKFFSLYNVSGTFPQEKSGARINRVLDLLNWPTSRRDVAAGVSDVVAQTVDDMPALQYLRSVVFAEQGYMWVNGQGVIVFRDRHTTFRIPADTAAAVFAPDDISDIDLVYADNPLYNEITLARSDGPVFSKSDINSQVAYGRRALKITDLLLANDNEIQSEADWLLSNFAAPRLRVNSVTIPWANNPATWQTLLGLDLTRRVNVNFILRNRTITFAGIVEGIGYNISRKRVEGQLWLSPNRLYNYLVLDHSVLGQLDSNRVAF